MYPHAHEKIVNIQAISQRGEIIRPEPELLVVRMWGKKKNELNGMEWNK